MNKINTLYKRNHKLYDYKIEATEKPLICRTNNGKSFTVYHIDGTESIAYGYGEKLFTYDYEELIQAKKDYEENRNINAKRKNLIQRFEALSIEEMEYLLTLINK